MEFPEQRDLVLQKKCAMKTPRSKATTAAIVKMPTVKILGVSLDPTGAPREEISQPATTGAPRNKGANIKAWAIRFTM